jgi:DNA-binding NtrC family response regulator
MLFLRYSVIRYHCCFSAALSESTRMAAMANILIVDDDDAVRGILFDLLSDRYECNTASTAEEAFECLDIENYNAVLTDNAMPGLTGVEVIKRIQLKDLETPVILISVKNNEQDSEALMKLGAFAFLHKPFSLHEIQYIVDRAVGNGSA